MAGIEVTTLPDTDNTPNTDRVLVYFRSWCVMPGTATPLTGYDIGVAEFDYNAATQPQVMRATVLNPQLFSASEGYDFEHGGGGCRVGPDGARAIATSTVATPTALHADVLVTGDATADDARLADPTQYETWTGTGWVAGGTPVRCSRGDQTTVRGVTP